MSGTDYEFDWDDNKAAINLGKHGVDFREAKSFQAYRLIQPVNQPYIP